MEYAPLNEIALAAAETRLTVALSDTKYTSLKKLIMKIFSQAIQHLSLENLTESVLLNELHMPSYESIGWSDIINFLPDDTSKGLQSWLKSWHEKNQIIPLSLLDVTANSKLQQHCHTIKISVPLPRLHILHTVRLATLDTISFISQGALLPATVTVKHTRRWDSPSAIASITSTAADAPLDFVLEVDAPSDSWLIGGQKRTRFTSKEDEPITFHIMIMPLKSGRILLPTVDVRVIDNGAEELSCETDYRSLGETVVVISDIKSTTVGLSELASGTEIVLLDTVKRR